MYQEEENELDALQSAKELEEEKKRAKEQQAKMVSINFTRGGVCGVGFAAPLLSRQLSEIVLFSG